MFPIMGWPYCHGATHIFNLFTIIYSEATKMDDLMKPFVRDGTSNASQFVHTHQHDMGGDFVWWHLYHKTLGL